MCKYITQGKADGNSCGAFTLAYYEWEISGHAKAEAADRAYISALYNDIVFGCAMPGFESYSNPMLMMRRLAKRGAKTSIPSRGKPADPANVRRTERGRQAGSRTNEDVGDAL